MKVVGIIGGIGPESTVVYYRAIIAAIGERTKSYPHIIINSIDLNGMLSYVVSNRLDTLAEMLLGEVQKLSAAGASFGLFASNTPHMVFEEVRRESPIPLLSIVEATRDAAFRDGLKRLGLFGTSYTMKGRFYRDALSKAGIDLVLPDSDEQEYIHARYFEEFVNGIVRPETRQRLLQIVERMKNADGIDGLILGGTELSIVFDHETAGAVPLLDTTRIHVAAAVEYLLS